MCAQLRDDEITTRAIQSTLMSGRKPTPVVPAQLQPEELVQLIREIAYRMAEARGFTPGVELQDWLDAEKEVLQKLVGGPGRPEP